MKDYRFSYSISDCSDKTFEEMHKNTVGDIKLWSKETKNTIEIRRYPDDNIIIIFKKHGELDSIDFFEKVDEKELLKEETPTKSACEMLDDLLDTITKPVKKGDKN